MDPALRRQSSGVARCKSSKVKGGGSGMSADEVQRLDSCREGGGHVSSSRSSTVLFPSGKLGGAISWSNHSNSLLLRRRRRNLSTATPCCHTRSLDRKNMPGLRQRVLSAAEKEWVRADVHRGCLHVFDRYMSSYLRPVTCTLDTTAAEIAARLLHPGQQTGGCKVKAMPADGAGIAKLCTMDNTAGGRMGVPRKIAPASLARPRQAESVSTRPEIAASRLGQLGIPTHGKMRSSLSTGTSTGKRSNIYTIKCRKDDATFARIGVSLDNNAAQKEINTVSYRQVHLVPATAREEPTSDSEISSLKSSLSGNTNRLKSLNNSFVKLMAVDTVAAKRRPSLDSFTAHNDYVHGDATNDTMTKEECLDKPELRQDILAGRQVLWDCDDGRLKSLTFGTLRMGANDGLLTSMIYVQLHGETTRRLEPHENPLEIQNEYLFKLGFKDPCRVQEEGMDVEIGCLIRFYTGKPYSIEHLERIQLSGLFNVRKGKMQLHKWTRRQVTLCGTCLIVSSVKDSHSGKMHVLPLIGGKVEEVKKYQHCLAFSSSGPQGQSYYISFDIFSEYLRWLRQASKIVSQRISSVDLSCCSLETLPSNLFYSQDLTHLNLKQNFLKQNSEPGTNGGLSDLQRFMKLKSLNLSNNHMGEFPFAVCDIPSLSELNLSCNALQFIPTAVGKMDNLQTILLDGNCLSSLPSELGNLKQLSYLGLSFNEFKNIPKVLEDLTAVERLCMSGNYLETLSLQSLSRMPHIKQLDLRLNRIAKLEVADMDFLQHVTHLDLRDNKLSTLDCTVFQNIEVLHCERNQLTSLKVSGYFLKTLYAASNELLYIDVYPVPNNLTFMDVSRNRLDSLPEWVCEVKKMEVLDISHNQLCELPARLFCSGSLRKLLAGHNQLRRFPERLERMPVEVLDIQHNHLTELPSNLFLKAECLRSLNASANKLEIIPPSCLSEESHSILQELYLTNNYLTDKCVPLLTGHTHLKVLHLAYNRLQSFPARMAKLEELEEIDLSGNKLKTIPTTIMNCRQMHTVVAHSNCIEVFPEVMHLSEIKCVDLSCNELNEITLPENLPLKLQELDLTGNPRLVLDHKTLELLNNIRCFKIDQSSTSFAVGEAPGAPAVWSHGYTEASGVKNRLCVAALSVNNFCDNREALYGVFDGDRNVEVPYLLQCTMSDILADELQKSKTDEEYMTNTFLVMQRKLGTAGQKLGGSAVLCHIRHDPMDPSGCFMLTAANVGKCQAVLCRDGKPLPLSKLFTVCCEEELERVKKHKAIVTEDNKVNGVTDSTRILGYAFLHPYVVPRPHVQSVTLTPQDEFFILGSKGLWDSISYVEAVESVRNVPDAQAAAKKLCSLAQSYGCNDSISAVVVQLNVSEDCFCCCDVNGVPPSSPGIFPPSVNVVIKDRPADNLGMPSSSSGVASEISSEISTSEMSSEVGSTASDEPPQVTMNDGCSIFHSEQRCMLHPVCLTNSFQRQLSSATFSSAFSDNGLDSEDEEPIEGVFSNGSRVEVEVDIHCIQVKEKMALHSTPDACDEGIVISANEDETSERMMLLKLHSENDWLGDDKSKFEYSTTGTIGRRRGNGSVAPSEKSHNLIEVAADAPLKKSGGYFAAPAQPDPDDQFIIPPELEEEVKEIMKQHQEQQQRQYQLDQLPESYDTPL
ncbi:PH domain leucine-rich repeat-containing protein phosphatase 1-like isoform X2 [Pristis pectinata]|uniref:PH domain leucine-rich repeat-containing protein phosphatase 1-like isoform X2 n=1 Tax=Pristis pectinata TaxID=685728 RepID=UPI00223CA0BA|nr:PH domain leucine-rich repeat-containing protein phosphatase 1-like isoform X2 [Pristis pectinata]